MKFNKEIIVSVFVLVVLLLNLNGCVYSFTGASVPVHLKTISIPVFEDRSGSGEAGLREDFTAKLIQKFIDDNTFQLTERAESDAVLECTITSLTDLPAIIESGESVSTKRITINVKAVYRDLVKKEVIFDKSFSNYGDYDAGGGGFESREGGIQLAVDKITEDILLSTVSNW